MTSYVTDIVRTIQDRRKSGPKTFKNLGGVRVQSCESGEVIEKLDNVQDEDGIEYE